ncbi:MAG TPA: outer membrane protein assembly factor BamD [Gammaproteobacteria bacterium]|nr:outer membrane protein assembly factor BamD [Gammaproteobacteria bacterium]
MNKLILFLSLTLLLPACTTIPADSSLFKIKYNTLMKKAETEAAVVDIEQFKKLDNLASTDKEHMQAELALAYAYYKNRQFDLCIKKIEAFSRKYPAYPHLDYVLYLRALATKASGKQQFLKSVSHISANTSYPEKLRLAYTYFVDLITRYPKSEYSAQALNLMKNIRTNLAAYEIFVARYALVQGQYKEVIGRTEYVLEFYKGTPVMDEAYELQAKAYRALGKVKKAAEVERQRKQAEQSSASN